MAYQIKQLSLGGVLDQAVAITKNHFGALFQIVAVTVLPPMLMYSFFAVAVMPQEQPRTPEEQQAFLQAVLATFQKHGLIFSALLIAWIVGSVIGKGAIVHGLASVYLGKPLQTGTAIKRALFVFWPLIGTSILFGLAFIGGLLLCWIPGIIFALWFALWEEIVVIEGLSGVDALKRSKALMKGNLGSMFVLGFIILAINFGIGAVTNFVPQPHVRIVLATFVQSGLLIFGSAVSVVFYFSARCKHEQFDLQLLADNVGAETMLQADDDNDNESAKR